jgi:hypothetical protein
MATATEVATMDTGHTAQPIVKSLKTMDTAQPMEKTMEITAACPAPEYWLMSS